MSGLMQLVNWTSVTTTVGMSRLDHAQTVTINEKAGTATAGTDTGSNFYVRLFNLTELARLGLAVLGDNPHYTRELRFFVEWESETQPKNFEGLSEIWSSGNMHCYRPTAFYTSFWLNPLQSITFHRFGVFDTATWDLLLAAWQAGALQRPWFNHATMPDPRS